MLRRLLLLGLVSLTAACSAAPEQGEAADSELATSERLVVCSEPAGTPDEAWLAYDECPRVGTSGPERIPLRTIAETSGRVQRLAESDVRDVIVDIGASGDHFYEITSTPGTSPWTTHPASVSC